MVTSSTYDGPTRRVTVLGATGSIGRSTEDVLAHAPSGQFAVEAVAVMPMFCK